MEKTNNGKRAVSLNAVSKGINGKAILHDVSFDVFTNEILALIGPNGAGKTTTVRCITGILNVDSGNVAKNKDLRIAVVGGKRLSLG